MWLSNRDRERPRDDPDGHPPRRAHINPCFSMSKRRPAGFGGLSGVDDGPHQEPQHAPAPGHALVISPCSDISPRSRCRTGPPAPFVGDVDHLQPGVRPSPFKSLQPAVARVRQLRRLSGSRCSHPARRPARTAVDNPHLPVLAHLIALQPQERAAQHRADCAGGHPSGRLRPTQEHARRVKRFTTTRCCRAS